MQKLVEKITKTTAITFLITTLFSSNIIHAFFSDVPSNHVYYDAIVYVKNYGIASGFSDGTFRPSNSISRGELIRILISSVYSSDTINNCTSQLFPDIAPGHVFFNYICVAKQNSIIRGYSDGLFHSEYPVKVSEASNMISNSYGFTSGSYYVYNQSDSWKPYIDQLQYRNALPTTMFSLNSELRRDEMAEIIYRLRNNITYKSSTTYSQLKLNTGELNNDEYSLKTQAYINGRWQDSATVDPTDLGGSFKVRLVDNKCGIAIKNVGASNFVPSNISVKSNNDGTYTVYPPDGDSTFEDDENFGVTLALNDCAGTQCSDDISIAVDSGKTNDTFTCDGKTYTGKKLHAQVSINGVWTDTASVKTSTLGGSYKIRLTDDNGTVTITGIGADQFTPSDLSVTSNGDGTYTVRPPRGLTSFEANTLYSVRLYVKEDNDRDCKDSINMSTSQTYYACNQYYFNNTSGNTYWYNQN